jgi:type IV pilus assembly protein PilM
MLGLSQVFGKETIVGVDIGSRFIKLVQAEAGTGGPHWRIVKAAVGPTPADSVREGIIVEPAAVSHALRELIKSASIDASGGCAAISGSSVIVRHVKLPKMGEAILRKGIRFEASKYISSSMDDSMIEFEIMGPVPGEEDKMSVMLVAVPNDMVLSRISAITGAGLEPIAIDIEAFALQRALIDLPAGQTGSGMTIALLDIGATTTDVNIITDGHFALTRNIAIAGDNFTNALKAITGKTEFAELEAIKHQVDMSSLINPDADPTAVRLAQSIQGSIDELLREVRRSINYYQSQLIDATNSNLPAGLSGSGGNTVSKIVISGGSARLLGLTDYMSARLGIQVEVVNALDHSDFDSSALAGSFIEENYSMLSTAIGLALKELADAKTAAIKSSAKAPRRLFSRVA